MGKKQSSLIIPVERIEQCIYVIRGQKVILDQDLAILYGVETKVLNQTIQRNIGRFPYDFSFQLTLKEWNNLKSQFVTSSSWGGRRKPPRALTEHGVLMVANLLKSERAIAISIEVVRAFVRMRHVLASQEQITKELADIKSFLLKHTNSSDREFRRIWRAIEKLSGPPDSRERPIGFDLNQ